MPLDPFGQPFAANVKFKGTLTEEYKDQIVRALTGLPRPSWLKVVRIRMNSSGYHIRITGKVKDEASVLIYRALAKHRGAMIACGDGTVQLTSFSTKLAGPF